MRKLAAALAALLLTGACRSEPRAFPLPPLPETPAVTPAPARTPSPPQPTPRNIGFQPNPDGFAPSRALGHVIRLAVEIGKREAGTPQSTEAATYIADVLRDDGYDVRMDTFSLAQGGESANVVATPKGFAFDKPYVMVGGHYDSLRGPGANDNASGVGIVLEIARVIRKLPPRMPSLRDPPPPLPLVVVAFGAEEVQPSRPVTHHVGSRHYVGRMSDAERQNLRGYLNLDMVGRNDFVYIAHLRVGPDEMTKRILDVASVIGPFARERITPDWSDNGTFLKASLNAGWIWSGEDPGHYHNPADTADRIRPRSMAHTGRLALATLRSYQ